GFSCTGFWRVAIWRQAPFLMTLNQLIRWIGYRNCCKIGLMRLCPCRITTSKAVGISSCAIVFAVLIFAAARLGGNGRTNVASARQGAIAIADSEFGRYTADQVIDGQWVHPNERPEKNRWQSGQGKVEPHWLWIRFKQPARIESAVIHPADTNNCPQVMIG